VSFRVGGQTSFHENCLCFNKSFISLLVAIVFQTAGFQYHQKEKEKIGQQLLRNKPTVFSLETSQAHQLAHLISLELCTTV